MPAGDSSTKYLKLQMRRRGWGVRELAQAAGLKASSATLIASGDSINPRVTHRIEVAFGCAIWRTSSEFARRRELSDWLGFDPWILRLQEVYARSLAKGIPLPFPLARPRVIPVLFAALDAAHRTRSGTSTRISAHEGAGPIHINQIHSQTP